MTYPPTTLVLPVLDEDGTPRCPACGRQVARADILLEVPCRWSRQGPHGRTSDRSTTSRYPQRHQRTTVRSRAP